MQPQEIQGHLSQHQTLLYFELSPPASHVGAIITVWWSLVFIWSSIVDVLRLELPDVKRFFLPLDSQVINFALSYLNRVHNRLILIVLLCLRLIA